ncbi:conjugative transfer ATPase [Vibrio sp. SCSIO 43155]|uniref:conjugative transfer ATPase n=1 Tax=Vibrio TaxID=662 RepID=UPI002075E60B|nr:conjugative transfer ATPase [Vibrio sp. SCSIO 43155]USD58516.1 conjugative transfer ATPase [Vibrio sp. SCSIO 43155]
MGALKDFSKVSDYLKKYFFEKGVYSQSKEQELYKREAKSFVDILPYKSFDEETDTFVLEDGYSRAAVFTISPISTVGKTTEELVEYRNGVERIYSVFEAKTPALGQWVLQEFTYNDNRISQVMEKIRNYVQPHAKGTQLTEEYLRVTEHHLRGMAQDGGIFKDKEVTREQWGLKIPRTKFVLYRRITDEEISKVESGKFNPALELNEVIENIQVCFDQVGITYKRDNKKDVLFWLYRFFNPSPDCGMEVEEFYDLMTDVEGEGDIGPELRETLVNNRPVSSVEENCWTFDDQKMRFLRFAELSEPPRIGQLTGEVVTGVGASATVQNAIDSIPDGCMMAKTVVFVAKSDLEDKMIKLEKASRTNSNDSERARRILKSTRNDFIDSPKSTRCTMGVYVSANTLDELDTKQRKIIATFTNNKIKLLKDSEDGLSLDGFIHHLPMNFKPLSDKSNRYMRLMKFDHAANLSFMFGRGEGSGNPALFFFNRGGAPVFHDPLNSDERLMNAFQFIVGPPGSGKSVSIAQMAVMNQAIYRPRMFIIEYGNSFGLLGDYFKSQGLSVNKMRLDMKRAPSLAPYADIDNVLNDGVDTNTFEDWEFEGDFDEQDVAAATDDEERDYLGEIELITFLMITGGEEREYNKYSRADRQLVRDVIVKTAQRNRELGKPKFNEETGKPELDEYGNERVIPKPTITSDIIDTMMMVCEGKYDDDSLGYTDSQKNVLSDMATTLRMFTNGFNAKLFNRSGKAFPDADVTIIDLAELAKDANKDKLAVAFTALLQQVNYLAEQHQHSGRHTLFLVDECHLVCSNPLIGPYLVKMVKCFRKLATWPVFATQNVDDMAGGSRKLLSMMEWYFALNTPREEALGIQAVKGLSDQDTHMLQTTRKQSRCYTEGVLISPKYKTLFRSCPPSLFLALAMTEGHEKAERAQFMDEMSCDEATAAYYVARKIDKARGFTHELEIIH